ncbi:hypothetical protein GCM10029963_78740 [Micromonospora andamanensis]
MAELRDAAPVGRVPSPEADAVANLTREALLAGIEQLKPDQQRVVALRYFGELSIEETATKLGKTPSAVKGLQYKALQALRGCCRRRR